MKIIILVLCSLLLISCTKILNVESKIDTSLKYNHWHCLKYYDNFTMKNEKYGKIRNLTQDIQTVKITNDQEDLKENIINGLNIGFLLKNIDQRPLYVTTIDAKQYEKFIEKELIFNDEHIGCFHVLMLIPDDINNVPAIIGFHGHGYSNFDFKQNFSGKELAENGFLVVMPFFRAMGAELEENIITELLYSKGFTLMGLRVYETMLLIKYLKYSGVSNIGIIGHSGGSSIANLVVRISDDIDAFVVDWYTDYLDTLPGNITHCETIPDIYKYHKAINDFNTLDIPAKKVSYEFHNEEKEIIQFFKNHLIEE